MAEEKASLILDKAEEQEAEEQEAVPEKQMEYVQIQPGDTLEEFAERYGTTPEAILERNKMHPIDFRFGYWVFV